MTDNRIVATAKRLAGMMGCEFVPHPTVAATVTVGAVMVAGHALSTKTWQRAVTCGDMRDRFPCTRCGANSPSKCIPGMSLAEIHAARDFINGYGWDAARQLAEQPS